MDNMKMVLKRNNEVFDLDVWEWLHILTIAQQYGWKPKPDVGYLYPVYIQEVDEEHKSELISNSHVDNNDNAGMVNALMVSVIYKYGYINKIVDFLKGGAYTFGLKE